MTKPTSGAPRRRRFLATATLALVAIGTLGSGAAVATDVEPAPMVLQNVSLEDIVANKKGICNGGFTHVMKNAAGPNNAKNYLNAARKCGLQVIFFFPETVRHDLGRVYPSKVAYWVNLVKDHPALYGYLTVKEPSWHRISATEIRSLYTAFHKADPNHPVIGIFGDIPHFNLSANPYGKGMVDILTVDWYPVETANNGCSRSGVDVVTTGPKHLKKVRAVVDLETPGTPIWLMVQTHKNLAPSCHKKQRPTEAQLRTQVRHGLTYAKASGIAFHTFSNTAYAMDERRDPSMIGWMRRVANQVHAGTFK